MRKLFVRTVDGSAHASPTLGVSLALAAFAVLLTVLFYGGLIRHLQANVYEGFKDAPIIRHILEDSLGLPIQPPQDGPADQSSERNLGAVHRSDKKDTGDSVPKNYIDRSDLSPATWVEVLRRLGIAEADSTLADYVGRLPGEPEDTRRAVSDDKVPLALLIRDLSMTVQGTALGEVTAPKLLAGLASTLAARVSSGRQDSRECWEEVMAQVMADWPGRWPALTGMLRAPDPEAETSTNPEKFTIASNPADCPFTHNPPPEPAQAGGARSSGGSPDGKPTQDATLEAGKPRSIPPGKLAEQPGLAYLVHFIADAPGEAAVARTLFSAFGVLDATRLQSNCIADSDANTQERKDCGGTPVEDMGRDPRDSETQSGSKAVKYLASPGVREAVAAEQFARQVLAAAMKSPDVARPKLWLDMLLGIPQAILELFIVLLLLSIAARFLGFLAMGREMKQTSVFLEEEQTAAALRNPDDLARKHAAEQVAGLLRRAQAGVRLNRRPPATLTTPATVQEDDGDQAGAAQHLEDSVRKDALAERVAGLLRLAQEYGWLSQRPPAKRTTPVARQQENGDHLAALQFLIPPGCRGLRPRSMAVLMAENAVRRMAASEPELEPFREFCSSRRLIVDETAWPLRYLARALPALGFVGTILGILFALNGADGIVRATTQAERVAAMSAVTAPLAFAFSHTLMALSAGLLTGVLIDMLTARERMDLLFYEETLAGMIDRARVEAADADERNKTPSGDCYR